MDFFFVFFTFICTVGAYRAIKTIRNAERLRNEGVKTTGIVTGYKTRLGRAHPDIQFSTQTGEVLEAEGYTGIAIPVYNKGTKVIVCYDAENPRNFILDSDFDRFGPYLYLFVFGFMFAALVYSYLK